MKTYKNVRYTKAPQLLIFLLSVILVFIVSAFSLSILTDFNPLIFFLFGIITSVVYYVLIKGKIIQTSDFKVFSDNLEWDNGKVTFDQIESYRTYFMEGTARIKINLRDNTKVHLTSSKSYCDSKNFISLCKSLDNKFKRYNSNTIEKKKTFLESDFGYYTVVGLTILYIIITVHSLFYGKDLKFGSFILGIGALGTLWAGIKINRKK